MAQEVIVTQQSVIIDTVLDAAATATGETVNQKPSTCQTPPHLIANWSKNIRNRLDRYFARENSQYEIGLSSRIQVCSCKSKNFVRLQFVLVVFQGTVLSGAGRGLPYFHDSNVLLIRFYFEKELKVVTDAKANTLKSSLVTRFESKYLPKGMEGLV